jgi:membrane protein
MNDDAAPLLSAGVAFYLFLSLFPGLLAALTIYGLIADPQQVEHQINSVLSAMPGDARGVLAQRLHHLATHTDGLSPQLALAILGALWTSSLGATGLLKAVKIAYDEEEHRNFFQLRWTGILLSLGALTFLIAAIGLLAVVPVAMTHLGMQGATYAVAEVLRWAAVVLLAVAALTLVYYLGADRAGTHPKWTSPGTIVAAAIWTAINAIFSWYSSTLADYGRTYGNITGGVVLLLWLYLASLTILFGAEVNAEAERQARGQVRVREKETLWHSARIWWRDHAKRLRARQATPAATPAQDAAPSRPRDFPD